MATSVNDVITVNVMNMDLPKWIAMAQDMDITVNDTMNILLGKRPNIWKDELEDWLIWILQSPNKNTALTNRSILQYSKTIQKLNEKQAGQSLFLSRWPNCYKEESTYPESCIVDLLRSMVFGFRMVVEDHGSSKRVILGIFEPYNNENTTILPDTTDKTIPDQKPQSTLRKVFQEIK